MALLLHIIIALSSIVWTGYLFFKPSAAGLKGSYTLVTLTLLSGSYLVWSTSSPILQSCITGLLYLAIVLSGIFAVHHRLAREHSAD